MAGYLTANQEKGVAEGFSLGFQTGARITEQRTQERAATDRMMLQQKAIADRDIKLAQMESETKAQIAKANADAKLQQTAAEFTQDSIVGSLKALGGFARSEDQARKIILSNPDKYDIPASMAAIEQSAGELQKIIGMASAEAHRTPVGSAFDASPFFNAASSVTFQPVVRKEFLEQQAAKTDKINAETVSEGKRGEYYQTRSNTLNTPYETTYAKESAKARVKADMEKLGGGAKMPESVRKVSSEWQGALGMADLSNTRVNSEPSNRLLRETAQSETDKAESLGRQMSAAVSSGDFGEEKKAVYESLVSQGLQPFSLQSRPKVHSFISSRKKDAISAGQTKAAQDLDKLSIFFTGLPADGRTWSK